MFAIVFFTLVGGISSIHHKEWIVRAKSEITVFSAVKQEIGYKKDGPKAVIF
jgi:hypothetical protein